MSISRLPTDCISKITSLIDASDIIALWLIGNTVLNTRLALGGVTHFIFRPPAQLLTLWPTTASYFLHLRVFTVAYPDAYQHLYVYGVDPNTIPKSVTEIRLEFGNNIDFLSAVDRILTDNPSHYEYKDVVPPEKDQLFPHLKTLIVPQCRGEFSGDSPRWRWRARPFCYNTLFLPFYNLKHIHLSTRTNATYILPPNIEIASAGSFIVNFLPPSLTSWTTTHGFYDHRSSPAQFPQLTAHTWFSYIALAFFEKVGLYRASYSPHSSSLSAFVKCGQPLDKRIIGLYMTLMKSPTD